MTGPRPTIGPLEIYGTRARNLDAVPDLPAAPSPAAAPSGTTPFVLTDLARIGVEPVGPMETLWLAEQRGLVVDLCDGYGDAQSLAEIVDRLREAWQAGPHADPTALAVLCAVALGDLVIRRVPGMGWVIATDRDQPRGTEELALAHVSASVAVFPVSACLAHWAQPDWLLPFVAEAVGTIRGVLAG